MGEQKYSWQNSDHHFEGRPEDPADTDRCGIFQGDLVFPIRPEGDQAADLSRPARSPGAGSDDDQELRVPVLRESELSGDPDGLWQRPVRDVRFPSPR